jgi:rfaE bifunctional protein kinase chain/domain
MEIAGFSPTPLVLVSGKFKVLHAGHMRLFKSAKDLNGKLLVCLDTTEYAKDEIDWRVSLLSNISYVDQVEIFTGSISPVLRRFRPSIVLKGNEFSNQHNEEESVLAEFGGRLLFTSGSTYFSQADLIASEPNSNADQIKVSFDFLNRNNIQLTKVKQLIQEFASLRVGVIGDLIVDEYIACHPLGMSQEEAAIVVTPVDNKKFLGGAAIVAAHSATLGASTTLISIAGSDSTIDWLENELSNFGVKFEIDRDEARITSLKQRYKSGNQTLLKLSHLSQDAISIHQQEWIISKFMDLAPKLDVLIFSDFSYGVLQKQMVKRIVEIANSNGLLIAADCQTSSQIGDLSKYSGLDLLTPTEKEARIETKDDLSGLVILAEKLRSLLKPNNILLKLGPDGLLIHEADEQGNSFNTDKVEALNQFPVDVSGAGDSLLVGSTLSLALSDDIYISALVGSIMAGIQVSRVGNIPIATGELLRKIGN